jgi:cbb3-type cytochrome oxidase subunit 3
MFQEYLAAKGLGVFPLLSLLIFSLTFLGVIAYVIFGLKRREVRDRLAALALEGDGEPAARTEDQGRIPTR